MNEQKHSIGIVHTPLLNDFKLIKLATKKTNRNTMYNVSNSIFKIFLDNFFTKLETKTFLSTNVTVICSNISNLTRCTYEKSIQN